LFRWDGYDFLNGSNEKSWLGSFATTGNNLLSPEEMAAGDRRGATEKAHADEDDDDSSSRSGSITMVETVM